MSVLAAPGGGCTTNSAGPGGGWSWCWGAGRETNSYRNPADELSYERTLMYGKP